MVDTSNLENMEDSTKRDYFKGFILPEAMRILSQKLKIKSSGKLPQFSEDDLKYCNDSGKMTIPNEYYTNTENYGDFILFVGSFTSTERVIAYATFCALGNLIFFLNILIENILKIFSFKNNFKINKMEDQLSDLHHLMKII